MTSPQNQRRRRPEDELELLSAYLDNELEASERRNLERELEREPRLRNELAELRATVYAIGELEPLRPPRSFTLDPYNPPAPLPQPSFWQQLFQPGGGLAGVLQLGSGLAGMALVLLATIQLLTVSPMPAAVPMPAAAPMMAATQAPPAAMMMTAPAGAAEAVPEVAPMAMPTEEAMVGVAAADAVPDQRMANTPDAVIGQAAVPASDTTSTAAVPEQPTATPPARLGWIVMLAFGMALLGVSIVWSVYRRIAQREEGW